MRNHCRPAFTIALCACAGLCVAGSSRAFTLNRIISSLDVGRVAAASAEHVTVVARSEAHRLVVPATAELFSPSTEIEVRIPVACDVEIQVVDLAGTLVSNAHVQLPAGTQKLGFCGRDNHARELPNGVYYYNVIVGDDVSTTRVTIAR